MSNRVLAILLALAVLAAVCAAPAHATTSHEPETTEYEHNDGQHTTEAPAHIAVPNSTNATSVPAAIAYVSDPVAVTVSGTAATFNSTSFVETVAKAYSIAENAINIQSYHDGSVIVIFVFRAASASAAQAIATNFVATVKTNPVFTATFTVLAVTTSIPLVGPYTPPIVLTTSAAYSSFNQTSFKAAVADLVNRLHATTSTLSTTNASSVNITSVVQGSTIVTFQIGLTSGDSSVISATTLAFTVAVRSDATFNAMFAVSDVDVPSYDEDNSGSAKTMSLAAAVLAVAVFALMNVA